jgi:L-lactate dehydrogenase
VESKPLNKPIKVSIVGTGKVGTAYAYTLLLKSAADEICLIDNNRELALGEALDLNHAMPFTGRTNIRAGTIDDIKGSAIVVIAAGVSQNPGETRMDLLQKNAEVVSKISSETGRLAPDSIILVVTNPVDVMCYAAMVSSGMDPARVIGSGTVLDTARLRYIIGSHIGIDPRSVHANVLGEHGDTELVAWSTATIAGIPATEWLELNKIKRAEIGCDVREAAYHIINLKGSTSYGIATALYRITESILKDLRLVLSVSSYLDGQYGIKGVYLGSPSIVGRKGVLKTLETPLAPSELALLRSSAAAVGRAASLINFTTIPAVDTAAKAAAGFSFSSELSPDARNKRRFRKPKLLKKSRESLKTKVQ